MDVVIVGGHGKIGRLLARELQQRGDRPRAVIRNPAHEADVREAGAEPVLCDLEQQGPAAVAEAIGSADALVFAAGAGPGSGAARKWTVDFGGAVTAAAACRANGIERYVMVSSIGADDPPPFDPGDVFNVYLHAKAAADRAVLATGLATTIVRPGYLTDDPPTGRVQIAPKVERGEVSRADVAAVLAEVLHQPGTAGLQFGVVGGEMPVAQAVAGVT
jgi:nucleoside-diphosphate-sugar epimerase